MSHKKIVVARLTSNHKDQITDLIESRLRIKSTPWIDDKTLDMYLSPSMFPVFFGAFQNQKLLSMMGLFRWNGLPYATVTYLTTSALIH